MLLGQVSWPDITVFLLFLALQLIRFSLFRTLDCVLRVLPFLLLELPATLLWERYLLPPSRRISLTRRTSLFQDAIIRCVRFAFTQVPIDIARIFFSKRVALPFLKFRMLRHGYIGSWRTRPHWREINIDGLGGLWIIQDPKTKPDIAIFYCHGGGFVLGSSYFYLEFLLTWISVLVSYGFKNPAIFALEYTLVPDESYPYQLEETIKGYSYVRAITGDASRVVVSGDSAGATLVLSLLLYLGAKCPGEKPRFATLISPWTNLTSKLHRNTAADYLDADTLHEYAQLYAGTADLWDPLLSPGECDDMQWLATSLPRRGIGIYYGSEEVFANAVRAFAERLKKVGRVICREDETVHAWPVAVLFLGSSSNERLKGLRQMSKDISATYFKYGDMDGACSGY